MTLFKFICIFILIFGSCTTLNITSPTLTNWGIWGSFERCPDSTFVQGFQLKTESYLYIDGDDTAVNSIKLFCGDPTRQTTPTITSSQGHYGRWGKLYSCYPDFLRGFRMRVVPNAERCGDGDNFAATNIRFYCNNGKILEGDGLNLGDWGEAQLCNMKQAVCGIQTQVEEVQVKADDTALNNVLMECCDLSSDQKVPKVTIRKQEIKAKTYDNNDTTC